MDAKDHDLSYCPSSDQVTMYSSSNQPNPSDKAALDASCQERTGPGKRLSTSILGLNLSNPILVASGPLSDSLSRIERAYVAGAGAVVTKTIYIGDETPVRERIRLDGDSAFNSTKYSHVRLDTWLKIFTQTAESGIPVIASIFAESPSKLASLARTVVEAGAPALELGISCPNENVVQEIDWHLIARYTGAVRRAVDVPFSVKLTAVGDVIQNVRTAVDEGADAISLSDSFPSLVVDVDNQSLPLGWPAGYSGAAIKPIVLHNIYNLRQSNVTCSIIGIGGIRTATDALEYIETGATAVQAFTSFMTSKLKTIPVILDDLTRWCESRDLSIMSIVGSLGVEN